MCEFLSPIKSLINASSLLLQSKVSTHSAVSKQSHTTAHTPKHMILLLPLRGAFSFPPAPQPRRAARPFCRCAFSMICRAGKTWPTFPGRVTITRNDQAIGLFDTCVWAASGDKWQQSRLISRRVTMEEHFITNRNRPLLD